MKFRKTRVIKHQNDFDRIFEEGQKIIGRWTVIYRLKTDLDTTEPVSPRLGIIASRKVGGAIIRNRAKRWFRRIFQEMLLQNLSACDMIWIARHGIDQAGYHAVADEIKKLLDSKG